MGIKGRTQRGDRRRKRRFATVIVQLSGPCGAAPGTRVEVGFRTRHRIAPTNSMTRVVGRATGSRPFAPKDLWFARPICFGAVLPVGGKVGGTADHADLQSARHERTILRSRSAAKSPLMPMPF